MLVLLRFRPQPQPQGGDLHKLMSIKQALGRLQPILRTMSTSSPHSSLSTFSSCEISDALIKLGYTSGGHIPNLRLISPPQTQSKRLYGPAFTVKMVLSSEKDAPKLDGHFVDKIESGCVAFVSAPPSTTLSPIPPSSTQLRETD